MSALKDRTVPWLTSAEAARHLGISPGAFRVRLSRARKTGVGLPKMHRFGRQLRFRQTDLDRLVEPVSAPQQLRLVRGRS